MFVSPKFCISIVFQFLLGQWSQEKTKTILVQNLGGGGGDKQRVFWYFPKWPIANKEKCSSINRIAITERASLEEVDPLYLFPSRKDDDDVRGIGKHDFRSVLLHHMLPNANRLRHAASEKNFSQFDDKDISHRPSLLLSSEESESLSLVPGLCCAMIALGAFFKCSRSSSLKNENKKGKKS